MPPIKKEDKRKMELGKDGGMDENEDNAAEEKETVTWTRVKAEMASVKNEITNEMNQKMNEMESRILQAIGMRVNQNQPDADYGTTQQNLNAAMHTPTAGLGSEEDDGGGCTDEEKVPNRTVSSKAWGRSMKSQEPAVVGGAADLDGYAEMPKDEFRNLVKARFRSTAAVSLGGSSKKVNAYIKTSATAVAGRKHGNVTALADAIGRALVTQLGLPYGRVNYIKGSAT